MKMETSRDGDKNECVKNCSMHIMHMHMHRRTSQFLSDQSYVYDYDYECVGLCAIYATSMIYLSYYDH
jgi:hypothetical protein